jgi:endonuclease/exonuclease/phosphatase family metal-dependent hydrolase
LTSACASLDADVLCLQEVDRGQARSGHADQTEAVARAMGAAAWRFAPAILGEPGAVWRAARDGDQDPAREQDRDEPGYGIGLVSRLAVSRWRVIRLGAAPVRSPVYVPTHKRFVLLPDEPRVALVAEIDTAAGPIAVVSTHLSFVPGWNLWQLRRLTTELSALGRPCYLLGDMNVPSAGVRIAARRWQRLARVKTFPAPSPKFQIDHVLALGDVPSVVATSALELPVSDHRALVVEMAD